MLLLLLALHAWAAETVVVGNVHDAATGEPLPNVQLYFRSMKTGTVTDQNGFFFMRVDLLKKDRLEVSLVGYKKQHYDVEPGQAVGVEVFLEERINALGEVLALPGANRAIPLMEAVRTHRQQNDVAKPIAASTHYFISDIQPRYLKKRLWKGMEEGMVIQHDSTYLIPLPKEGYSQYMIPMPERLNFYESHLHLMGATLLSPLAPAANGFYHFSLMDSAIVRYDGKVEKHYRVHYFPKNSFNPTLEGVLTIDSATYGLREVTARVPREVGLNFLTDLRYRAQYTPDGALSREELQTLMEMAVKTDTSHIFPSLLAYRFSDPALAVAAPDTIQALDSAYTAYLQSRMPQSAVVMPDDSVMMAAQKALQETPLFKVVKWLTTTFYTGYMPTGTAVDFGRINEIIHVNNVEQLHMGLPLRTNARMHERFSLEGYIAWGIKDRGLKYNAGFNWLLPTERRQLLRFSVSDRYVQQDVSAFGALKNENGISNDNLRFTSRLFNGVTNKEFMYSSLGRKQEVCLAMESDWLGCEGVVPAVETTISLQAGRQGYGDAADYRYREAPMYGYASVRGLLRLSWAEKTADLYMRRRHIYSHYPVVYIGAELGSYRMPQAASYAMYGLLNLMVRQDVSLGMGGRLQYLVEGGLVLGTVPYPLLSIMSGNTGYTYSPDRFTLMSNYQYAADKYVAAHVQWDGRGILFNQIPGVRYARLHELLEMKIAYGSLSEKHRRVIDYQDYFGEYLMQPLRVPYVELGVGIGNILRVGNVYSIWRLTDRKNPYSARWGVRFCFDLSL